MQISNAKGVLSLNPLRQTFRVVIFQNRKNANE